MSNSCSGYADEVCPLVVSEVSIIGVPHSTGGDERDAICQHVPEMCRIGLFHAVVNTRFVDVPTRDMNKIEFHLIAKAERFQCIIKVQTTRTQGGR